MSPMGRAASRARAVLAAGGKVSAILKDGGAEGACINTPDCPDDGAADEGPAQTQSETTIAVDAAGQHVVIGFNDFRGFSANPISVSGFMYSDDGGETFVDGGQLPSPGTDVIGSIKLPMMFGDPDVKYAGGCTFLYSSIMLKKFSATQMVQTMGVHRSTDCGHTWTGPYEVTPATNPNGLVDASGVPLDAADKEFIDVDPDTGRVLMSWSNFTPVAAGHVEISTAFSDDITTAATPTWSSRVVVASTGADGQASMPRFAGSGLSNAYVVWERFDGLTNQIALARSTDNGTTWSTPVNLAPTPFFTMDEVLGNDRIHSFPAIAIDRSNSTNSGNLYLVYSTNGLHDGGDIAFQRSSDQGLTFSAPILLNSRPGDDRSQWFPSVAVDSVTGRVHVFYYDQGIAASGDLTEVMHTYSEDGGVTWKQPLPLTERPFHAGWGNDTGQPNLGDYNQSVAQNGELFAAYALASRPPAGFVDGQPSTSLTVPDVAFLRLPAEAHKFKASTLALGSVVFTESGGNGFIDPGEIVQFVMPLRNYVTNPLNAAKVRGVHATLSSVTPGVSVIQSESDYDNVQPGATEANLQPFVLQVSPSFAPGTFIELVLTVASAQHGTSVLLHTVFTGTPQTTTLLSENFDEVAPGSLPAGWSAVHGAGANVVRWTTTNAFCGGGSNAAFHQNAADGPGPGSFTNTRWERLLSPAFNVPADADHVTVDMDVCYDTEDDPDFNVLAYDGVFLRLTDLTPGRTLRSVLAEAFEDAFTTGTFFHYPKHLPRSGNPYYFENMSAWAGYSAGLFRHVHLRLPGMAGSRAQLRFEFTQDSIATCSDVRPGHSCGVAVDNVIVSSVKSVVP